MATRQRKSLTHVDTRSEYETTDEIAQKMGYPNARLYALDMKLAELADEYNETRDAGVLKKHQALYKKMLKMGMTPLMFSAATEVFVD